MASVFEESFSVSLGIWSGEERLGYSSQMTNLNYGNKLRINYSSDGHCPYSSWDRLLSRLECNSPFGLVLYFSRFKMQFRGIWESFGCLIAGISLV